MRNKKRGQERRKESPLASFVDGLQHQSLMKAGRQADSAQRIFFAPTVHVFPFTLAKLTDRIDEVGGA